jgi:hypothetical protein
MNLGHRKLRDEFGLTPNTLSRLTGLSERTLATWEAGGTIGESARRTLKSVERLLLEMVLIVRKRAIADWLDTPNEGFAGLKPIEVIERGETDRIWRMIFYLGSGTASLIAPGSMPSRWDLFVLPRIKPTAMASSRGQLPRRIISDSTQRPIIGETRSCFREPTPCTIASLTRASPLTTSSWSPDIPRSSPATLTCELRSLAIFA